MHARLMSFGQLEIDGSHYDHDVIVEGGRVRRRKKRPSKALRDRYGHRLLVAEERSRGPQRLIMGTGASGRLPDHARAAG